MQKDVEAYTKENVLTSSTHGTKQNTLKLCNLRYAKII